MVFTDLKQKMLPVDRASAIFFNLAAVNTAENAGLTQGKTHYFLQHLSILLLPDGF